MKKSVLMLLALALPGVADARDTRLHLDMGDLTAPSKSEGSLDGSVRFYFDGQATPAVVRSLGDAQTNRKTNAFNKSDAEACRWVMRSALLALQAEAKARGANAVVGIKSNYKGQEFSSATQFECGAGTLMAGVALKGTYAEIAPD